ncbi:MAG: SGNH/GDSL hydrolase family protein [Candidatus Eremiobacteraeota bacterium]|nr:SGNH/GDSL hydrolase family protein [Candidatus Eremiobacteraeota bacterium]
MPVWLKKGGLFLLAVLPLVLLVLNSNEGWHRYPGLWETWRYLVNDALLAVLAMEMLVFGFSLRQRSRAFVGLSLCLSSLLTCYIALDLYVVLLNHESTGPGGRLCLTHRNWFERVVSNNKEGFWEQDLEQFEPQNRQEGVKLIAAVGDSFTWGQGLASADLRFTDRLDEMLGPEVEIVNFGHGGYNTRDLIDRVLPVVAEVKPDVVVYFYLSNDIHDGIGMANPQPKERSKWEHRMLVGLPVYNFLYWKVLAAFEFRSEAKRGYEALYSRYQDSQNFTDHEKDLKKFTEAVRAMGATPVAVNLPFPHLWSNATPELRREIVSKVVKALENSGMPTLDLSELEEQYPVGQFEVNSMDAHPSAAVHQAIADKVEPWLKERVK